MVSVCLLVYIYFVSKRTDINRVIKRAVDDTEYGHCEFVIYDKSTEDVCDRLIVVKPFDWTLWNVRNTLFVINPERPISCELDNVGAIRILSDRMYESCLDVTEKNLTNAYVTPTYSNGIVVKRVPYEIDDNVFTILSAIDRLVELQLLKFDLDARPDAANTMTDRNIYAMHDDSSGGKHISKRRHAKRRLSSSTFTAEELETIEHNKRIELGRYATVGAAGYRAQKSVYDRIFERMLDNPVLESEFDYLARTPDHE